MTGTLPNFSVNTVAISLLCSCMLLVNSIPALTNTFGEAANSLQTHRYLALVVWLTVS
jgi:hypothetical protein